MKKCCLAILCLVLTAGMAGCSHVSVNDMTVENGQEPQGGEKTGMAQLQETEGAQQTEMETDSPETEGTEGETESEMAGEDAGTETAEQSEREEPEAGWEWQHDLPENHGLEPAVLESLHATLDTTDVLAAVVVRDDYIVDEYYKDGYDETSVFALHSCSKSVTSALMGIAVDRGYVEGVNVPVTKYLPQIAESGDAMKQQITIWHLLTHTSGISGSDTEDWEAWRGSENWVDFVLNRPMIAAPGTTFSYFTGNSHLLAAIIQEATGSTLYDFGKTYLFGPLGMDSVQCQTDAQGIGDGGNGFAMNVYDMAKLGRLFLHGGVWEREQVISAEWISESTGLQFKRSTGSADYGYQWWVRTFGEAGYDAFFAQGHGGQYIFVVPELELIVVFTSNHTGSSSMYWQFMTDIVEACSP